MSNWCDAAFDDPRDAVRESDFVILCLPVDAIVDLVRQVSPTLRPGTLVTDVGSTKSRICRLSSAAVPSEVAFVGSHPMAGSEKSGFEYAQADLFAHRACIITPLESTSQSAVDRLAAFWRALKMEVSIMSPERHDEVVANISHLPHLIASTLAIQLTGKPQSWAALSGNGLRDVTRIASGHPALWRAIFEQNRDELLRAIDDFEIQLGTLKSALHNEDYTRLRSLLQTGKNFRDKL